MSLSIFTSGGRDESKAFACGQQRRLGCLRRGECAIEVDERLEVGTRARKEVMHKSVERR